MPKGLKTSVDGVLNDNRSLHYLVSSCGARHDVDPPKGKVVHIEDLNTYLAQPALKGSVGLVEIFGGEPGVGKFSIRRRLARGGKFD